MILRPGHPVRALSKGTGLSSGRHVKRRFAGKLPVVLLVVFSLLAVGFAGSAYAALRYDRAREHRILPGVSIEGVDVSNMTRAQAVAAVSKVVQRRLDAPVHVVLGQKSWDFTVGQLGVSADVASAVDKALAVNDDFSWMSRVYHRMTHADVHRTFPVATSFSGKPIVRFVDGLGPTLQRAPRDAGYDLVDDAVVMTHAHPGQALKSWMAREQLQRTVKNGGGTVDLATKHVAPKVPDSDVGKLIVVSRTSNRLWLYDDFKVERTYGVATAAPGFETPPGRWTIIDKVENPTWHNPCFGEPDCWAAGEPEEIPPGPGNPLGTRALYLNADGIRIHGTPSDSSIGSWASHGCIRMHISESEALYPLVPIGTPVFVIGAPPWGDTTDPGAAG
jgi:lipoprotein-anchoring transpeptidase ErfK/SrfK